MVSEDKFIGAMLGLALADAIGAVYEGGLTERIAWRVVVASTGKDLRWTDDTQMAMVLAQSLIEDGGLDVDRLAKRWAQAAQMSRGYGPGAYKLLGMIRGGADWRVANKSVFPDGSFGNGGAMRAAPIGLYYHRDPTSLELAAEEAAEVTHAHPLGIEGGRLIAQATAMAMREPFEPEPFLHELLEGSEEEEYRRRLERAIEYLKAVPEVDEVRSELGNTIVAHESAVTAVYAFCRHPENFSELMEFVLSLGGDTDTIGAMAGGLFGAKNGMAALPAGQLAKLEARDELERLGRQLCACAS